LIYNQIFKLVDTNPIGSFVQGVGGKKANKFFGIRRRRRR